LGDIIQKTCRIDFEPIGKRVDVHPSVTLLEAAQQAGVMLNSSCGGAGRCGQCRLTVMQGKVSAPTEEEKAVLNQQALDAGERLACRVSAQDDIKVHVPAQSLLGRQRLQLNGDNGFLSIDPLVRTIPISVSPPSLEDTRSDLERLALSETTFTADPGVLTLIASLAREKGWVLDLYLRENEIIGAGPSGKAPLGVAVDLGTTKIAAALVDLTSGDELALAGAMNPQIAYGEDVISRLTYCQHHPRGAETLTTKVRQIIDQLMDDLVRQANTQREQIADLCIVGNTAMTHLLLGLPTRQLAVSPFVAATHLPMDIKARDLGLSAAPGAYVYVLPGVGGFVGADHVAMILASGLARTKGIALGVDIGTNTEIVLADPKTGTYTCASCASGPAFEGAHISDGMRASSGAIEWVSLTAEGVRLKTIDNAPAVGLCGSGMVDALAELVRCNALSTVGRLDKGSPFLRIGTSGPELLLAPGASSGSGRDVVLTQKDVSQIQLAKGAIRAGLESLLAATGTLAEDVTEVIVAGAFGSYLDIRNAFSIGLLPHLPYARYRQVGNAALVGAKRSLLSLAEREHALDIHKQSTHVELSTFPKFNRLFTLGMQFPLPKPV
jgi:uncharacterized 2Fe-2S/4Fe-4S cluster protein (DUF4445 family)